MVQKVAELKYYQSQSRKPGPKKPYEQLEQEEKDRLIEESKSFFIAVDKLNLMVVPLVKVEDKQKVDSTLKERLRTLVSEFVQKVDVFKRDLFPSDELADRIFAEVKK